MVRVIWRLGCGALLVVACGTTKSEDGVALVSQAVTTCDSSAIFGFESASSWTPTGATVATNTRRIQGATSLGVQGSAHIELKSVASCSLGTKYDSLGFYVAGSSTTATESKAKISVRFDSVSRGVSAAVLGTVPITVPAQGHFARVELKWPSNIASALSTPYTDLRITLILDAVGASSQSYLVDDLSFHVAPVAPAATSGTVVSRTIDLNYPSTSDIFQLSLLGQQSLSIADAAKIQGATGGFATSASVGATQTAIGVEAQTGTLLSVPKVVLADRAIVNGNVVTGSNLSCGTTTIVAGKVTCSNGAKVTGTGQIGAPLAPPKTLSWKIDFQQGTTPLILDRNVQRSAAPGAYSTVQVQDGAKLTLSTGTYHFQSLTLEQNSILSLITDQGPVVIYVRDTIAYRTKLEFLGRKGDFVLTMLGTTPFAIETPFDGILVSPKADVRFGVGSTPHAGAAFAKALSIDPRVVFSGRNALPLIGVIYGPGAGTGPGSGPTTPIPDKGACANALTSSPTGLAMSPRDLQEALLRYCGGTDTGPCETALLAQINLDYFTAAGQAIRKEMPLPKHAALMADRERKTQLIHGNETLSCQILAGDPDGDLVPPPLDSCPNTPPLTATLANGCTDPVLPKTPPIDEVLAGLPKAAIGADPRCVGAPSPSVASPFGAWRYPSDPSVGKSIWISKDPDTSSCPKWYFVEVLLTDGTLQTVGFSPNEDVTLPWIQRASNILQFNVHTSDPKGRGAWANYGVYTKRYRVLVVNAAGRKSAWSNWFKPGQEGCAAGACSDF
jgi:hypothetical protein